MPLDTSIYLSPKEVLMQEMVMKVLNDGMSYEQAAARYCVSERTVRRKVNCYLWGGLGSLAHRSRGRLAQNRTPKDIEERILSLYENHYSGYNFTHFHQKLQEVEHVDVSYPTVYTLLTEEGYRSPRAHKMRRKENLHPARKRRKAFGELIQMDASIHSWLGRENIAFHLAIDDATSRIVGGHFEEQETLHGYYMVFAQILRDCGCPEEFYTDRRTVFSSQAEKRSRLECDSGTQFQMAAARLGVLEIHTTSVPQAKGRIERAFQTFQDRLIQEMRSAKISSLDKANEFLPAFIADHNTRYSLDEAKLPNVFSARPSEKEITMGLAVVHERKVKQGTISFKGKAYEAYSNTGRIVLDNSTKVLVLHTLSDELYMTHGNNLWTLVEMETKNLPTPEHIKGQVFTPPKNHPWKEASYRMMLHRLRRAS
jgi:transposase